MIKLHAYSVALLLAVTILGGCDKDPVAAPTGPSLVKIHTYDLSAVPEPSGLSLDTDGRHLWTVSDQTGSVYRLTTAGSVETIIDIGGDDLEGVAVDPTDGSLFIVEEGLGYILHLDRQGNLLDTLIPAGLPDLGNQGLEGITIDPTTGHLFILKEMIPGLLIELDSDGTVLATTELDFADDYSGLSFDAAAGQLLVISDLSATLTWCTTDGEPVQSFNTGLEKGEGIALDAALSILYAVSDSRETLTVFDVSE